ncbi:HK97 family phage prohead protease [Salinisphaera orenii]|uniref:Peptidase U35 n=1 Tax=Salinisphaera orenii YIM 95161 TaxID=1051139 RepID=A0A423PM76_9GAMM|nr:HK97 family phage prohead protease [Salinisphaera halophila]ROO26689.1 peptidase U35 [Salinisphaera halophila YIM 95161]
MTIETRTVTEYRAQGRTLSGYAATFGTEARIGSFSESIRAGAFSDSLSTGRDILALVDHDATRVLGRTKTGTLKLVEDARGLQFEIDVPDTAAGRDVLTMAERGDLGGMSFGFNVTDEHWTGERRELRAVDLREISVVNAWPAYAGTSIDARAARPRLAGLQRYLRTI